MNGVDLIFTVQKAEFNYLVWLQIYTQLNIGDVALLFFFKGKTRLNRQ